MKRGACVLCLQFVLKVVRVGAFAQKGYQDVEDYGPCEPCYTVGGYEEDRKSVV